MLACAKETFHKSNSNLLLGRSYCISPTRFVCLKLRIKANLVLQQITKKKQNIIQGNADSPLFQIFREYKMLKCWIRKPSFPYPQSQYWNHQNNVSNLCKAGNKDSRSRSMIHSSSAKLLMFFKWSLF